MVARKNEDPPHHGISRRHLIGALGTGAAGALAMGSGALAAEVPLGEYQPLAIDPQRFGRIFPDLPPFRPATPAVKEALTELGRPGGLMDAADDLEAGPILLLTDPALSVNNRNNEFHTAGTTFFGQFMDHDMTFDTSSPLGVPTPPQDIVNARTPSFDLDSVYGAGPVGSPALYDPADPIKLVVGFGGQFEDLPRMPDGTAVIGDPRNDENLMLLGIHCAFLLFHNNMVDKVRSETPGIPNAQAFAQARRLVTWHYHWIILYQFLAQFIGRPMVDYILAFGRNFYRPAVGQAFMPVEFQGAAYRFGHSMVRPSYRANLHGNADTSPFFGFIFDPSQEGNPDPDDLRGGFRAPRRFIDWDTFFDFQTLNLKTNKRIDTHISTPLFHLPLATIPGGAPPISLPQRNLLRQLTWEIPSGQALATKMREPILSANDFPELQQFGVGLESHTPLWYYVLKEAAVVRDGIMLGPVGTRIVGEVIIGLLQQDPNGFFQVDPSWRPTLPSRVPGEFTMSDLLVNAGVDPASRHG